MKVRLKAPFTDVRMDEAYVDFPAYAGDTLDVTAITARCPDLGCCECNVAFQFDGMEYVGSIYFSGLAFPSSEIAERIAHEAVRGGWRE